MISSAPTAVMAGGRLTVFTRTMHRTLTHRVYDPQAGAWTDWIHLGDGQISSAATAMVTDGDRLTVFARTLHETLTHKFYDGGWTDWIHLGDGKIT
jgi:3-mercaptopyruvate sulfurtransferase SseA